MSLSKPQNHSLGRRNGAPRRRNAAFTRINAQHFTHGCPKRTLEDLRLPCRQQVRVIAENRMNRMGLEL